MGEERSIKRWKNILGMNSYGDSTNLPEGVLCLIQNMRPRKGSLYTREGLTKFDSAEVVASNPVLGLGRYYPDTSTSLELAVSNGILKSSLGSGWTQRATGLSSSNLCKIEQFKDKALICDQSTGLLVYQDYTVPATDEHSTHYAGVYSPKVYKLISSFEDAADWTCETGITASNDQGHQLHGRQSVKFTLGVVTTKAFSDTFTALDLDGAAVFSDGSTSDLDDYISLFIIRGNPSLITSVRLVLGDASFTNTFYYDLHSTTDWIEAVYTYSGLHLRLRKRYFQTLAGTPNWSAIAGAKFIVTTTGATSLTLDWLRLEKSGPIAWELLKTISDCEPTEGWTASVGSIGWNYQYKIRGDACLEVTPTAGAATISLTPSSPINLTTFTDGTAASTIDDIEIYLGKNIGTATPSVRLCLYTSVSPAKYWYADFTVSSVNLLTPASLSKASFSNSGSPPDWSSIVLITIVISSAGAAHTFIDAINLVRHKDTKTVAEFDPTEGWIAVVTSGVTLEYTTTSSFVRSDQGSTHSLHVTLRKNATNGGIATVSYSPGAALDLSIYSTGIGVQSTDKLGCYAYIPNHKTVGRVTLQLGPVGMATHYFSKTVEGGDLTSLAEKIPATSAVITDYRNSWFNLHFPISEWDQTGSPSWGTIAQCRVILQVGTTTIGTSYPSTDLYLDSWDVKRASELTGVYYYKETYVDPDGNESEASLSSEK